MSNYLFKHRPQYLEEDNMTQYALQKYEEQSNLPRASLKDLKLSAMDIDLEAFTKCKEYQDNIAINVLFEGKGMYIYGTMGNGKSTWTYRFARQYMEEIARRHYIDQRAVYYANVPELMSQLKMAFKDDDLQRKITHAMRESDLVIFDDIGAENSTDWANEQLYLFINYRYANGKACVFTSNYPLQQLEPRVADRIREMCTVVQFRAPSDRGNTQ